MLASCEESHVPSAGSPHLHALHLVSCYWLFVAWDPHGHHSVILPFISLYWQLYTVPLFFFLFSIILWNEELKLPRGVVKRALSHSLHLKDKKYRLYFWIVLTLKFYLTRDKRDLSASWFDKFIMSLIDCILVPTLVRERNRERERI